MDKKIIIGFLIGFVVGGIVIGFLDAYRVEPLFSSARMMEPNSNTPLPTNSTLPTNSSLPTNRPY